MATFSDSDLMATFWGFLKQSAKTGWQGISLVLFGMVIGVMTALNEQVGSTSIVIATLVTFVGGSLAALYRPPDISAEAREWIVQAMGFFSLGLLVGLGLGFYLRYYDQAYLMTRVAKERANLDLELQQSGQHLADYWPASQVKFDGKVASTEKGPQGPVPSVTLREGVEKLREKAVKQLSDIIANIDTNTGKPDEQERMRKLKERLQKYRDVIDHPKDHSSTYWMDNVEIAAEAMAGLKEDATEKLLRDLREQTLAPK